MPAAPLALLVLPLPMGGNEPVQGPSPDQSDSKNVAALGEAREAAWAPRGELLELQWCGQGLVLL